MSEPLDSLIARLEAWAQPDGDNDQLAAVRDDIRSLINRLPQYACHKAGIMGFRPEDADAIENLVWYHKGGEDHGWNPTSWRDRAEELEVQETRLYWLTDKLHGRKWHEIECLGLPKPEDEKYVNERDLLAAIDREIEKEKNE